MLYRTELQVDMNIFLRTGAWSTEGCIGQPLFSPKSLGTNNLILTQASFRPTNEGKNITCMWFRQY